MTFRPSAKRFVSEFTFQVAYMYGGMLVNMDYIAATEVKDAVSKSFRAVWPLYQLRRQLTNQSTFLEDAATSVECLCSSIYSIQKKRFVFGGLGLSQNHYRISFLK